ncbi:MAG: hypothetical protein ABIW79_00940 [Gemmatimonas sp.]
MLTHPRDYLAEIGRRGGVRSRRTLTPETARAMVRVREARRAFARYHARCFWSYRRDLHIGLDDVPCVAEQLMKHGDRMAILKGRALCR